MMPQAARSRSRLHHVSNNGEPNEISDVRTIGRVRSRTVRI